VPISNQHLRNIMRRIILIAMALPWLVTSCKKDTATINASTELVPLTIEFDNIVGSQNLALNTGIYNANAGETFSVQLLKYYVSNFKLTRTDGTEYVVPQDSSYFLIEEGNDDAEEAHLKVPVADYAAVSFMLGVDSLRSTMDITKRLGVLNPTGSYSDMYWNANSGYIFFKMEGVSPQAPVDATGQRKFKYHIGGFGGATSPTINNIKTIKLDLTAGGIAKPRKDRNSEVHLMVDIDKVLSGTNKVSIAANPSVMFTNYSVNIANNFSAMFRHDHTHN